MIRIFYHQVKPGIDCPDGIAAAWVALNALRDEGKSDLDLLVRDLTNWAAYAKPKMQINMQVTGVCYQSEIPNVEPGDRVYIVDFSFPAAILEEWADIGADVTVIDHHKTAMQDLAGLSDRVTQKFDMNECGATLTWKYFHGDKPMPAFLEFVRSRDLWLDCDLMADPISETLIVHEAISALKMGQKKSIYTVYDLFDQLVKLPREDLLNVCRATTLPKLEAKRETVLAVAKRFEYEFFPDTHIFPHAIPTLRLAEDGSEDRLVSDVCSALYHQIPEAAFIVCITSDGTYSLRSNNKGNNTDVGAIAKVMGGGGHRNAAAFKLNKN